MAAMADRLPQGRYVECADGSHLAMYDDPETYFAGLIDFLRSLDAAEPPAERSVSPPAEPSGLWQ